MKKLIILTVGIAVLLGACSRQIDKVADSGGLPTAPDAPSNLVLTVSDGSLALSWDASAAAVDKYLIYRADSTAASFSLLDSATTTSYIDNDVQNGIRYYFKVSTVSVAGIEGPKSRSVAGIPGLFSIRIAGDDEYVNNTDVTILVEYPPNASHIMVSNDLSFSSAKWEGVTPAVTWELPDLDGSHTVYAKFKMQDGNESSIPVFDDVKLDRVALIESFVSDDGGAVLSAGDVIHFSMTTGEPGGRAAVVLPEIGEAALFDNGTAGDAVARDGIYEYDFTIPPGYEFENGAVFGTFRDAATNAAPQSAIDHLITVRNAPKPVTVHLNGAFQSRLEIAWTMSEDPDFASYRIYRSESIPVTENSDFVTKLGTSAQLTVTDTNVVPATTYYYIVIVSDQSGLKATSNTLTARTLANEAPDDVVLAYEKTSETGFKLTWTRNDDSDFESYRIYRSETQDVDNDIAKLYAIVNTQGTTTFTGDNDGDVYYYVLYVYDRYGLPSAGSNVVPSQ
ncbi:MAG: fibronectin type III domain-containing protein [candidate division Zixibacteria bacterium]|nr:fibronectin type III domain-containing protein [candidate division Zixibacteria bacterium]MBU2626096.1 fibronectin type III domain-containing protein [candidate division Zixibacteria bacterium]